VDRKENKQNRLYRNRKLYIVAGLNVGNGKPCTVGYTCIH